MRWLLVFLLWNGMVFLKGQHYAVTHYGLQDGLPQSQIYSMVQDHRGYIWLGTRGGGVARFNGLDFEVFDSKNALNSDFINQLHFTNDSLLYIVSDFEVQSYNGVSFKTVFKADSLSGKIVKSHCYGNTIGLECQKGFFKLTKTSQEQVQHLIIKKDQVSQGNNFVWSADSIVIHQSDVKKVLDASKLVFADYDEFSSLWLVFSDGRINHVRSGEVVPIRVPQSFQQMIIYDACFYQGDLVLSTMQEGVFFLDVQRYQFKKTLNKDQGLSNNHCRSLLKDQFNNLWIGTSGGGLNKYAGLSFENEGEKYQLSDEYIYQVYQDDRYLWVANGDLGVYRLSKESKDYFGKSKGVQGKIRSIVSINDSITWVGGNEYLYQIINDSVVPWNENKGVKSRFVHDLLVRDGKLYLSGEAGIQMLSNGQWTNYDEQNGLMASSVSDIELNSKGEIYFLSREKEVGFIQGDTVKYLDLSAYEVNKIKCIHIDQKNYLWIALVGKGILRVDLFDHQIKLYDQPSFFNSKNIYQLASTANHDLWIGTAKGMTNWKLNGQREVEEVVFYDENDGLTGIESNLRANHVSEEAIYVGTINGLFKHQFNASAKKEYQTTLHWNDIQQGYQSINQWIEDTLNWNDISSIQLAYDENQLFFNFEAVDLNQPKSIYYSWKMENWDQQEALLTRNHEVYYSNLSPGKYQFVANAYYENGTLIGSKSIDIEIIPPFWKRPWFYVGFPVLLVVLVIWLIVNRYRSIARKNLEKNEKLELQNAYLNLKQKATQLQMNPHFIFNVLNSIQSLISQDKKEEAKQNLNRFAKMMRTVLKHSQMEWVDLADELNLLESYVQLELAGRGQNIEYRVQVDQGLLSEGIKVIPMILQPFVENALIHAFKQRDNGKIELSIEDKESYLFCRIKDNGVGVEAGEEAKTLGHDSQGLKVTQERIELYIQEVDPLLIETIYDEEGKVKGTEVKLKLPIKLN